jgi:protein involved in sex pheromone biosynthesis
MKKTLIFSAFALSLVLVGCGSKPVSDADIAKQYGMTMEEYQEQKEVAARMNMSVEDHLKNGMQGMDMDMK